MIIKDDFDALTKQCEEVLPSEVDEIVSKLEQELELSGKLR